MTAVASYSTARARIASYSDDRYAKDNRKHALINWSVYGSYFLWATSDPSCKDFIRCHVYSVAARADGTECETLNSAYLCSQHIEECVYYRPGDFLSEANDREDFSCAARKQAHVGMPKLLLEPVCFQDGFGSSLEGQLRDKY
jgi:hypothetical protein